LLKLIEIEPIGVFRGLGAIEAMVAAVGVGVTMKLSTEVMSKLPARS